MANRLYGALAATQSRQLMAAGVADSAPGNLRGLIPSLILAAAGLGLILVQTRFGPGAGGDSSSYLMGAENLLEGNGFSRFSGGYEIRPITGFPPFYSAALAAIGLAGVEPETASRYLNALLFGANILLAGYLVYAFSTSTWAAAIASAFFLLADTMLELHSWVMSEPVFIFLTLAAIWSLLRFMEGGGWGWLAAAALLTACSSLTRYVGPALSAAGGLVLLLFGASSLKRRALQAASFTALSLLPLALWLRRNAALAGTLVNRDLAYHPMDANLARLFLAEISSWFVPHQVPLPTGLRAGLAVAIASGLLGWFFAVPVREWVRRRERGLELRGPEGGRFRPLPILLGLYAAGSLLILFINSTLLDASTTATAPPRYLAPIFAVLVHLTCLAGVTLARRGPGRLAGGRAPDVGTPRGRESGGDLPGGQFPGAESSGSRPLGDVSPSGRPYGGLLIAYTVVVLAFYAAVELRMLRDPLTELGYTGRRQLWAEAVAAIRQVPAEIPLVSNNPELVYILVGRPAYVRPISFDNYQGVERTDYEQQYATLRAQLGRGGVFVLFDELEPDDQAFIDRMRLSPLESFPQVRLYQVPDAGA